MARPKVHPVDGVAPHHSSADLVCRLVGRPDSGDGRVRRPVLLSPSRYTTVAGPKGDCVGSGAWRGDSSADSADRPRNESD